MDNEQRGRVAEIVSRYRRGRTSRRNALRLLGLLGLGGVVGRAIAEDRVIAQDQMSPMPTGTMTMPAMEKMGTPAIGPQIDGTTVWKVQVGGMDMESGIDMHAFFPGEVTINAGDSVLWAFAPMGMPGFHTVTFMSGAANPPIFIPDIVEGTPVASPEGPPRLLINPLIAFWDGRAVYDGTGTANSGLDVLKAPDDMAYALEFPTPGTYDYQCAAHADVMTGRVIVQEAGAGLPNDIAGYEAVAQQEMADVLAEGTKALADATAATPMAADGTAWDVSAGAGGLSQARVMRYIPAEVRIKVGDTVRWTNGTTGEPHTVTFLGGTEQPANTLLETQTSGPPKYIQNYQTFLPMGEKAFDGTGYRNSGFLGVPPEIGQAFGLLGDSYELTFTKAGWYPYYCVLHAGGQDDAQGMTGTVVVHE